MLKILQILKSELELQLLQLIEAAGGLPENTGKIISGGPMMGRAVQSADVPVTKGTSGILINETGRCKTK